MPIYDLACPNCETEVKDKYFKANVSDVQMPICAQCGHRMAIDMSGAPTPLTKTYGEDREVIDYHIRPDGKPQRIRSWGHRKRLMKEFNLEEVGARRGMPGAWT